MLNPVRRGGGGGGACCTGAGTGAKIEKKIKFINLKFLKFLDSRISR